MKPILSGELVGAAQAASGKRFMASNFTPLATAIGPSISRTPNHSKKRSLSSTPSTNIHKGAMKVKHEQHATKVEDASQGVACEYVVCQFSDKYEECLYLGQNRRHFFCKLTSCRLLPNLPKSYSSKDRMVRHMQEEHGEGFVPALRKQHKVSMSNNLHVQAIIALQKQDVTIEADSIEGKWFCKGYVAQAKEWSTEPPSQLANQGVVKGCEDTN